MAQARRKHKKRERTLGQAIGLALAVTVGVGFLIFLALVLVPGTALHQFYLLAHYNASSTLRSDILFQQWMEKIDEEEALFATPLSLFSGGLTLGWFAPRYAARRRVLLAGAMIALGLIGLSLAFLWPTAVIQQNLLNAHEGGAQNYVTAPFYVIRNQLLWGMVWILVCSLGTQLGLWLRARRAPRPEASAPALKSAGR